MAANLVVIRVVSQPADPAAQALVQAKAAATMPETATATVAVRVPALAKATAVRAPVLDRKSNHLGALRPQKLSQMIYSNEMERIRFIDLPQKTEAVFVRIFTNAGRFSEAPGQQGIGHLLDHYVNGKIFQRYFNLDTNAHIDRDFLWFSLDTNKKNCLRDIAKFLQHVFNPDFSDQVLLDFERQALINELKSEAATAYNDTFEKSLSWKFSGYPNVYKEIEKVRDVTLSSLEKYHKMVFSDYRLSVFVGGYKLGRLKKEIRSVAEKHPGGAKSNALSYRYLTPTMKSRQDIALNNENRGQAFVYFVARSFSHNDPVEKRIATTIILRELVSHTKNSPFLPLRRMGVYGLNFDHVITKSIGFTVLSAVCSPDVIDDVVATVRKSIRHCTIFGVTKAAIARHRKGQREYYQSLKNNNGNFFSHIVDDYLYLGETISFNKAMKWWGLINPDYVKKIAEEVLTNDNLSVVTYR